MTTDMKLKMLKSMTDEEEQSTYCPLISVLLRKWYCKRAYPYENVSKVPMKYDAVHVEIAAYMINKRGAEGEVSHSENGVSRTYEDGDIPPSLLRAITPVVGVL